MKRLIVLTLAIFLISGCSSQNQLERELSETKLLLEEIEGELIDTKEELRLAELQLNQLTVGRAWGEPAYEAEYDFFGGGWYTNKIRFYGNEGYDTFKIEVDDLSIVSRADNLSGEFEMIEISDGVILFAVGQLGPSSDDATSYYYYDLTGNITFIDTLPGRGEGIIYHGDGTLTTRNRGDILHTWFYEANYRLNEFYKFQFIAKDLYEMNWPVKVLQPLALQKSRSNTEIVTTLQVGEEAVILDSDNKEWCLVRTQKGVEGWFAVENYYHIRGTNYTADQVFEGLSFAD